MLDELETMLLNKKIKNDDNIDELDEKIDILNQDNFNKRLITAFFIGAIFGAFLLLIDFNNIPIELIRPITIGLPPFIGILGEKLIRAKKKVKEKLRNFSKPRTNNEKLRELVMYEIEKKQVEVENDILDISIDKLNTENHIADLQLIYINKEKSISIDDEQERKLNYIYADNQQKINKMVIEYILKEKIFDETMNHFMFILEGFFIALISLVYSHFLTEENQKQFLNSSAIITPVIISLYFFYSHKFKNIISDINQELLKNDLNLKNNNLEDLNKKLINMQNYQALIKIELEKLKYRLKKIKQEKDDLNIKNIYTPIESPSNIFIEEKNNTRILEKNK